MVWNPFNRQKNKIMNDEQKIGLADAIAEMLKIQLFITGNRTMDSLAGGPKAIGYVYGYIEAVLRSRGLDMADMEIGIPITFQVIRRLWPEKDREYVDFLVHNLSSPNVVVGCMHGGQQYINILKAEKSGNVPMGIAKYILEES